MAGLSFDNVSVEQIVAMADGLLSRGDHPVAKNMYAVALRRAGNPVARQRIRVRLGLASNYGNRTALNMQILTAIEAKGHPSPFVGDGLATWMKNLPFEEDARFQELTQKHASLLPVANWQWNLNTVLWAVRACRDVEGDYVELGVFKGHTTLFCGEYVDFGAWPKQWWLYDTFDGIPDDQLDSESWGELNKQAYGDTFSFEEVTERFADFKNVKVIKGRVPEILEEASPPKIAFMHVDMNNAAAEIGALDHLFERVSPGGIIVFDDFCWQVSQAQYKAETAWFAERGLHVLPIPTGQGVFIKR